MLYSYKQQYPSELPNRIRLSNGMTRTDKTTFTDDEITDAGYTLVPEPPAYDLDRQTLEWSDNQWKVNNLPEDLIAANQWARIRSLRDGTISNTMWRVQRVESEQRLGLPSTDDLTKLDEYIQALRDITKQLDPFNIVWPMYGEDPDSTDTLQQ